MILISSDMVDDVGDILEGVAYIDSDVICYTHGLGSFKAGGGSLDKIVKGKFFLKYLDGNDTIIRTDEDGNELVFYYSTADFWCVSTSFFGMANYLSKRGCQLTASKKELAKLFVSTSLFEQPYSESLAISEIQLLEANCKIVISGGVFNVCACESPSTRGSSGFFDRVTNFINESRSAIAGLSGSFEVDLELSGGIDSRVVLGLALPYSDGVKITSDNSRKERADDFLIATLLSENYKIKMSPPRPKSYGSTDLVSKWSLFKLGCIGVSRTNLKPNSGSGTKYSCVVRLNGGGGESNRVYYNTNSQAYYNVIDRAPLDEAYKSILKKDLCDTLEKHGYAESPQQAMVSIYKGFRQRYFAGRAWYYSLLGLVYSPMASKCFGELCESPDLEKVFGCDLDEILDRNLIILFILYILDPALAIIRFDEDKKNFRLEDIRRIQGIAATFDRSGINITPQSLAFGSVSQREVLPKWADESLRYEGKGLSYESMIDEDIKNVVGSISSMGILSQKFLQDLSEGMTAGKLDPRTKNSLLHLSEILRFTSSVGD